MTNPHLIDGFKYNIRVYALVTSFNPLKVYLFNDCLVHFCTEKYSMHNRFAHLTSYSVNKKNKNAKHSPLWNLKQLR